MVRPSNLNPIENLWSIIKHQVYGDGRQYSSKNYSWIAIKGAVA